jgi:hypothetical protein
VKSSSVASRPNSLVCPLCEASKLYPSGQDSMRCRSCGAHLQGAMLETLRSISALPDALGSHACECGHPEMRLLPDDTLHCPACGSEILPIGTPLVDWKSGEHGEAYWCGWLDGRYREIGSFADNPNLARGGRLHRTGSATTGVTVQAAKPASPGIIETPTPEKSSSDEEAGGGPCERFEKGGFAMNDR